MIEVIPNLYVGTIYEVPNLYLPPYTWRLVNVSKTLHLGIHGWKDKERIDNQYCYVYHEDDLVISLNWVDAQAKYFDYKNMGVINVNRCLKFIHANLAENKILITCDQGHSRSPSIALVYMAKMQLISDESYEKAAIEFYNRFYKEYNPGQGIQEFLTTNWQEFRI